jgi:hypothetical protein
MASRQDLQEALHKVQQSPEWQLLWAHLLQARQDCLLRLAVASNWNEFLEIRGEINAINIFISFGDALLDRLEEARVREGEDDAGFGRQGGYTGS